MSYFVGYAINSSSTRGDNHNLKGGSDIMLSVTVLLIGWRSAVLLKMDLASSKVTHIANYSEDLRILAL